MTDNYYDVKAISASQVKDFANDPLTFWERSPFNPNKAATELTDAMQFGSICHKLLLEGETSFFKEWQVLDFGKSRKNKSYDELVAKYKTNFIAAPSEYERAQKMVAEIKSHPIASKLLEGATSELPVYFKDAELQLPCKAKFDSIKRLGNNQIILNDYKTTSDLTNYTNIYRFADTYNWLQAAFYRRAIFNVCPELKKLEADTGKIMVRFWFIVQSSVEGQETNIACFEPSLELYREGDAMLTPVLQKMDRYLQLKAIDDSNLRYAYYQENINDTFELNIPSNFLLGFERKGFNKILTKE